MQFAVIATLAIIVVAVLWGFSLKKDFELQKTMVDHDWKVLTDSIFERFELLGTIENLYKRNSDVVSKDSLDIVTRLRNGYAKTFQEKDPEVGKRTEIIFKDSFLEDLTENLKNLIKAEKISKGEVKVLADKVKSSRSSMLAVSKAYNESALTYNTKIEKSPNNLIAMLLKLEKSKTYYGLHEDKEAARKTRHKEKS